MGRDRLGAVRHYDLAVVGSGSGNSIIDERFSGRRVALVDDGARFGGTCLNHGCIPTKMFVVPADYLSAPAAASAVGVHLAPPTADWASVRDRIFGRIDPISDGGERWRAESENVTLYRETARFTGTRRLRVGDEEFTADQVVIAAGSRPTRPPIDGLDDPAVAARVHTSDTVMRLDALPASLVIVGGGFVAAEFAHIFAAFGTRVTVLARSQRLLRTEDDEISRRYTQAAAAYTDLRLGHRATRVEATDAGVRVHTADADGETGAVDADLLLLATGRTPNGDRLDAEAGGVAVDERGFVVVDERQATNVPGVWALGDVCSPRMLKHVANHESRVVAHNLLHPDDPVTADHDAVPHAVFGHPQVAAVGLTEQAARDAGHDVAVAVQEYGTTAYGWALEDEGSCVKLIADRATGLLLGGHIIGEQAASLIQPVIQAMATGLGAAAMARGQYWIHPALTEVVENALLALDLGPR